jgi:SpoVK/Ycf46/Vps4 family AAA+-type ATPase
MLSRLKQLVDEVAPLHSKLILLIGPPGCGKTALLSGLASISTVRNSANSRWSRGS